MAYQILQGDVIARLRELPDESVHCVVTSPPYWGLRNYETTGQIGLEKMPREYLDKMVAVFREMRRVLRKDGTCWVNMGDSYVASACGVKSGGVSKASGLHGHMSEKYRKTLESGHGQAADKTGFGLAAKNLVGMPWRLAFALQEDGWWLRQDIIWSKPNPMPESVTDRCTKAHEYIFLLTKSARYFYDQTAILEPVIATHARLSQNVQDQIGFERAHAGAKTNGNMKAVGRLPDAYKGSLPGRNGGPGQDRRGAGDRKLASSGSGTKNNESLDAAMAIMPDRRNKRSVWEIATESFSEAHFATFPTKLVEPCIRAGCPHGGTVLDPFSGSGTTGLVAIAERCDYIGIELSPEYVAMSERRLAEASAQLVLL